MLDITLRELWWKVRGAVYRWRLWHWPQKPRGSAELHVRKLDNTVQTVAYEAAKYDSWSRMNKTRTVEECHGEDDVPDGPTP